jgi:hypothetical protein
MPRPMYWPQAIARACDRGAILSIGLLMASTVSGACNTAASGQADAEAGIEDVGPDLFPDFGEIPDGHVLFVLSYGAGPHSPDQLYAQEWQVSDYPEQSSELGTQQFHAWVGTPGAWMADSYLEAAGGYDCPCSSCGGACDLTWFGTIEGIYSGRRLTFDWDGLLWDRLSCPDGISCVEPRAADVGTHSVEFCSSFTHVDCPAGLSCRLPDIQCQTVEFDYPHDQIVWHTLDCSADDEPGDFPGACIRTTVRLPPP